MGRELGHRAGTWDMALRDRDTEREQSYEPGTGAQGTETPTEARNNAVRAGTWCWN